MVGWRRMLCRSGSELGDGNFIIEREVCELLIEGEGRDDRFVRCGNVSGRTRTSFASITTNSKTGRFVASVAIVCRRLRGKVHSKVHSLPRSCRTSCILAAMTMPLVPSFLRLKTSPGSSILFQHARTCSKTL